jgi:glutamine synthetase
MTRFIKMAPDVTFSSRTVLKSVLALFDEAGLEPVIAPELEFFLVKQSSDANAPLITPPGRSGRAEKGASGLWH